MGKSMLRVLIGVVVVIAIIVVAALQWPQDSAPEFIEIGQLSVDGNAEIVRSSADGRLLVYTNAKRQSIDIVDLSEPTAPVVLASVNVPGEPTSVDLSPDGLWALATVHVRPAEEGEPATDPRLPGVLAVIDLREPAAPQLASIIGIDNHPDSIAITTAGDELVAVIAIENEEIFVKDGVVADADQIDESTDISSAGVVQIVSLNPATPRNWSVTTLEIPTDLLTNAEMLHPEDPQPEFVALSPGRHMAAVSLQENNGILLVDLAAAEISGAFSLGTVANRPADLKDDGATKLNQNYPTDSNEPERAGTRIPDAIAFSPDGQYLFSADEGEARMTGGRGFSVWTLNGELAWDDGGEIEALAAKAGLYPDNRSDEKGIEIEGISTGRFGSRDFAFAVSERGSFMVIYDISNPNAPEFVQILETGTGPEGVIAIPSRNLIVVAAEKSGTLTVFRYESTIEPANPVQQLLS
jgi:DNA-binding beta-propeller fold protein YncE